MTFKRPTPTLLDVAAEAGVSTATVSRCLNFPDQVAERTRIKVHSAVEALGYSPNFGAKAMAARRTMTIGAIIPTMENAIFARGLQAFQEELRQHGFTMLVASTNYRPEVEEEQIRSLVARGADALLLIGHERSARIMEFLDTQAIPSLVTWAYDPRSAQPSVGFDNRAAMTAMARHVLSLGHRKLALISAATRMNDRAAERLEGIREAMREAGLDPSELQMVETTYGIEEGASAFTDLMGRAVPPTTVFCGNDVLAVGALRAARLAGLQVPQDVSIIGFDDIELAQVAYPALTTVHVPHREMGRQAATALARMVLEGKPMETVCLQTQLVFRDTLGPSPQ